MMMMMVMMMMMMMMMILFLLQLHHRLYRGDMVCLLCQSIARFYFSCDLSIAVHRRRTSSVEINDF
jgi:hypothetical protein